MAALLRRYGADPGRVLAVLDGVPTVTYAEQLSRSRRVAAGLAARGAHPGDRVHVQLPNCREFLDVWFPLPRQRAVLLRDVGAGARRVVRASRPAGGAARPASSGLPSAACSPHRCAWSSRTPGSRSRPVAPCVPCSSPRTSRRRTQAFERRSGSRLLQLYGMTETVLPPTMNPDDGTRRWDSIGRPLPGVRIDLLDERGEPFDEVGRVGEMRVAGSAGARSPPATGRILQRRRRPSRLRACAPVTSRGVTRRASCPSSTGPRT